VTEPPSALLERAAALIQQRAEAIRSPEYWDREVRGADMSEAGAAWAKLTSPSVAPPLVEWLRRSAGDIEVHVAAWRSTNGYHPPRSEEAVARLVEHHFGPALAFARTILGEHPAHDWVFPYDAHPGARECRTCGAHDDAAPCRYPH
jgi:hypothetical protein